MSGTRNHWGPYGWKTLHSVAALYPDEPTLQDKQLARTWLDNYTSTITCPFCREHFTGVLETYRRSNDILANRHNFFWFTIKAHNTANAQLNKPQIVRYADAYAGFKAKDESGVRDYYYRYIGQVAVMEEGVDGFVQAHKAEDMMKVDRQVFRLWFQRTNWDTNGIARVIAATPELTVDVPKAAVAAAKPPSMSLFGGFSTSGGWSLSMLNQHVANQARR